MMKSMPGSLSEYVDKLQRSARYTFTREEAVEVLRLRDNTMTKALQRLVRAGRICQVQRGFYLVVPIEYASGGAPPVDWFIDDLMKYVRQPYYVGVLTAAAIHGAGHQRPQEYQVVLPVSRRSIRGRSFRIRFFRYADMARVATEGRQTYTGTIPVSSPEATALDLVRFQKLIGGLDSVLSVLIELGEEIRPRALVAAAKNERVRGVVQRLGWLLDRAGWQEHTQQMASWVVRQKFGRIVLNGSVRSRSGPLCRRWNIIENDQPEEE